MIERQEEPSPEPMLAAFQPEPAVESGIVHVDSAAIAEPRLTTVPHRIVFWHRGYAVGHVDGDHGQDVAVLFATHVTPAAIARAEHDAALDRPDPVDADATIVICSRNRPEQLARCLRALGQQTFRAAQVLVVDSASDDERTQAVANAAGAEYLREDRPGLDLARNRGIRAARCGIVLFTDDDVVLHPRWLERMLRAFADGSADAVTGLLLPATLATPAQRHFEQQWSFGRGYERRDFDGDFVERHRTSGVPAWGVGAGASMAFRRSCFERIGLFDERLDVGAAGCSGDSEYWHRILTMAGTCRYEPGAVAYHYHRADDAGLRQQLGAYMRGHAAALLVQHERAGGVGDLRRLILTLPTWYAYLLLRRLSGERTARTAYLREQVLGLVAGVRFYLRAPRPYEQAVASPSSATPSAPLGERTLVSIVIPAYNAEATLDATLTSVRNQSHVDLEIIVVDDGSRDATRSVALAHAAADPRVRLLRQENGGVASARNAGLAVASADYVAFVDADDLCAPERTAKLLSAIDRRGPECALAYTWSVLIDQSGKVLSEDRPMRHEGWVHDELCKINFVGNGSAAMVRTAVARAVGGFNPGLRAAHAQGCEDFDFYLRMAERHQFALVPEFLTGYRQSATNMSSDRMQMYRSIRLVEDRHGRRVPTARPALRLGRKHVLAWLISLAFRDGDQRAVWQLTPRLALISPRWAYSLIASHLAAPRTKAAEPMRAVPAAELDAPVLGQEFPVGPPVPTRLTTG